MTQEHPITPSPQLVQEWREAPEFSTLSQCALVTVTTTKLQDIATRAAQWGADQELEACCEIALTDPVCGTKHQRRMLVQHIRERRRPKPPSLKEQALEIVRRTPVNSAGLYSYEHIEIIRRALESIPDPSY